MKRIYHENELEEGDFLLFLYGTKVVDLKLKIDYGLVTEIEYGDVFVKWFFDPCQANNEDDPPERIENMPAFNGEFYLVKKGVPIRF